MSEASNSESVVDAGVSEAAAAVQEESFKRPSHGGARNNIGYSDKLLCMETHCIIRSFLAKKRCYCRHQCLHRLALQGQSAEKTLYDMRSARFASNKWCFCFRAC